MKKSEPVIEAEVVEEVEEEFLSADFLAKKEVGDYVEIYEIVNPRKRGKILIRAIRSTAELEEVTDISTKVQKGKKALSSLKEVSDSDIFTGMLLYKCVVKPALDMDQAISMVKVMGPEARVIMAKIYRISGIEVSRMAKEEEKLKNDPFSAVDSLNLHRIFAPSSIGSEFDDGSINGISRVSLTEEETAGRSDSRNEEIE